jgi:uncharacterized membrane-anchored protein YhcB (DUF1043 family)
MKLNKDNILYGLIIVLILLLIGGTWYMKNEQKKIYKELQKGNKIILEMDETTKEGNGQYTKLVDYFNTEKELNNQLKEQNKELYKLIKKQEEKLLMINNTVISLQGQLDEGFGSINEEDTNRIDLELKYPNEGDNFITWDGYINRNNAYYNGEWKFGKLPLQIILTETERGMWRSRLIGPEWLVVDSMEINSLPLPKIEKQSNFGLILGGGYVVSFNPNGSNGVSIGAGLKFKNHNLIINGTTNQEIGFNYYYNIFNFKKK